MAKLSLNMDEMQEEFFGDTAMIGIVTALPGYRICWILNKHFGIDFFRDTDQTLDLQKKGRDYFFPVYRYDLPNSSHQYLLYKLKNGKESLLPETKNMDYLWLIRTSDPENDAYQLAADLRNLPDIQLAQLLNPAQLKSLNNLLV
jgi:hypothetical protein